MHWSPRFPPLARKMLRDLAAQRGPFIAIAVVAMSGIALFITLGSMRGFLERSLTNYYRDYRFADVFVHCKRAPTSVIGRVREIPGIMVAEPRVVYEAILDVPGLAEPATGRFVSIPGQYPPRLNVPHLRTGRWPSSTSRTEVLASESFAQANHLKPGDSLGAVLAGHWVTLHIVGVAISPEYVYELQGNELFPDTKRFGVFWMPERALAVATGLQGAFNDLSAQLVPGASEAAVLNALDRVLAPYGTLGAYGRSQHVSNRFISDEIEQNTVGTVTLPIILLGVSAFLLNVTLTRLVATQRGQIAVLKAFGYTNGVIGRHYLALALVPVVVGAIVAIPFGQWMGSGLAAMYARFYRFPSATLAMDWRVIAEAVGVGIVAAAWGAIVAVRSAVGLPPAEGMRPPLPAPFRDSWMDRIGFTRLLSPSGRIVVRNIGRRPLRALAAVFGIALAFGIVVVTMYTLVAIEYIEDVQFQDVQREDISVAFRDPVSRSALGSLRQLPGVLDVEPVRMIPVEFRHGAVARRSVIVAMSREGRLRRVVDQRRRVYAVPSSGLLLTTTLANILHVTPGDSVTVDLRDGTQQTLRLPVADVVDELLGTSAYTDLAYIDRLTREPETISGALLATDPRLEPRVYARLKALPALSGASIRRAAIEGFEGTIAQSFRLSLWTAIGFACIIAAGVVYNGLRVTLSERSRELASLRVLGFTRREVNVMLFSEQGTLTTLGMLVGIGVGFGLCVLIARWATSELFRIPLVVPPSTYGFACVVIIGASILSGGMAWRRVRELNMVEALKTGE